jgi:hypothetical protein
MGINGMVDANRAQNFEIAICFFFINLNTLRCCVTILTPKLNQKTLGHSENYYIIFNIW